MEEIPTIEAMFSLHGRTALITGGSTGIGGAIARVLAKAGADIVVHYSSAYDAGTEKGASAREQKSVIEEMGRRCWLIDQDLAAANAVDAIADSCASAPPIDILVINASVQCDKILPEITAADLDREYAINFKTSVLLMQKFVPSMAARDWGRVLSIGSIQQARPRRINATYSGLKAAQETLMRQFAVEYGHKHVLFNTLSPGLVATERNRDLWDGKDSWWESNRGVNPLGIISGPEDYAGAALLLCSDAARFITGANLYATGGGHLAYLERDCGQA